MKNGTDSDRINSKVGDDRVQDSCYPADINMIHQGGTQCDNRIFLLHKWSEIGKAITQGRL